MDGLRGDLPQFMTLEEVEKYASQPLCGEDTVYKPPSSEVS